MSLKLGQRAPEFSLPDTEGHERSLGEFVKKGTALLAFFPFAFSGVCDKEMCTFRDSSNGIASAAQVIGISVDSLFSLKAFAQTYDLRFPLLSDFNRKVAKAYGVLQDTWVGFGYSGVSKRAVFLVDSKGVLRYKWTTETPANEPPYAEVGKAAEKLKA